MSFFDAVRTVLTKYAVFDGRATRAEYWYYQLAYYLAYIVLLLAVHVTGTEWPTTILILALFIPSLSVAVRRLHDTDHSGWWLLIVWVIPFLVVAVCQLLGIYASGVLVLIKVAPYLGYTLLAYFFILDGTAGENTYGPDPMGG